MNIWECKIGESGNVPSGGDAPMREAVAEAYREVAGEEAVFIFSGWGGSLTESERAALEDRPPRMADGSQISDELVTAYRDAWATLPAPATPAERVRAGLAAALAAARCRPVEACGEVGTSFPYGSHQQPMDTEPCALPYDHEEDHDWAQREAAIRRALYDTLSPNFEIDAEAYNAAAVVISKLVEQAAR